MEMNWIPVTERLPEESGRVLVRLCYGGILIVNYSAKHKQFNSFDYLPHNENNTFSKAVIAWMPLSELTDNEDDESES